MYNRQSTKELTQKGFVFATSTTNSKLNAKFRKKLLGNVVIELVATTDFCYDIYCMPDDLKKVQSIY
jgi:hypothetical protein